MRNLIEEDFTQEEIEKNIDLKLGNESFNFHQLTQIWYKIRSYTAHCGGISIAMNRQREKYKPLERLIKATKDAGLQFAYGDERSLLILQHVTEKAVKNFIM